MTFPTQIRVGWLATTRYLQKRWTVLGPLGFYRLYDFLSPSTRMRVGNVAEWIDAHTLDIKNELYNPAKDYDVVAIVKGTSAEFQKVAQRVKSYGGKIIYDANVNYWETWGEYDSTSPRPTTLQQTGAIALTQLADMVVADSSYLAKIAQKYNPNVCWIPDNVDQSIYSKIRDHQDRTKLRIVWSGMSHKADHLTLILPVLDEMSNTVELVVVSETRPSIIERLPVGLPVYFVKFSDRRYAETLSQCDVIISPRRLLNAYDMGHTEYKITLGMSAGLPAIASPQQSYIEAISYKQGGIIVQSPDDWLAALRDLNDTVLRRRMGTAARETVEEKYSKPVVAKQYADVIRSVVAL